MLTVNLTKSRSTWEMGLWACLGIILIVLTDIESPTHCSRTIPGWGSGLCTWGKEQSSSLQASPSVWDGACDRHSRFCRRPPRFPCFGGWAASFSCKLKETVFMMLVFVRAITTATERRETPVSGQRHLSWQRLSPSMCNRKKDVMHSKLL